MRSESGRPAFQAASSLASERRYPVISRSFALGGSLAFLVSLPMLALSALALAWQAGLADAHSFPLVSWSPSDGAMLVGWLVSVVAWLIVPVWCVVVAFRVARAGRDRRLSIARAVLWIAVMVLVLAVGDYLVYRAQQPWRGIYYS
jgi:hypothetical protein